MTVQRIAALTADMERLADAAEWDRVREAARRRDSLLRNYAGKDRGEVFAEALRINESIRKKVLAEREATAGRLAELRHGRQSVSRYGKHQDL